MQEQATSQRLKCMAAPACLLSGRLCQIGRAERAVCNSCRVEQQPCQQHTATLQQTVSTVSRRGLLQAMGLGTAALQLSTARPALGAIVDEAQADSIFNAAADSVVSVIIYRQQGDEQVAEGTGSGWVYATAGDRAFIVTNYHCIALVAKNKTGDQGVSVKLTRPGGRAEELPAQLAGYDAQHDLAVLEVQAPRQLQPMLIGASRDLRIGQAVYALGSPLGLSRTLTAGVVSGLDRAIPSPTGQLNPGAIQTDAAISSGSSGGPLLDSAARVVGVSTATFTKAGSGRSSGVNFALPIEMVSMTVPNLIVYGTASGKGVGRS